MPHREANIYSPGWIGNVVVGAVAALVFWGLYGPMAKLPVIGPTPPDVAVAFTIAELAGSIVTGIGGGRILSSEVERKALAKTKTALTKTLRQR